MTKNERHAAILSLITENEVETQQELQILLRREGFKVTQATISRDISELKIIKGMSENEVNCYMAARTGKKPAYNSIFSQSVLSIDYALNTVVVKCRAGLANAACAVLDDQQFDFVVGTIAGDDTIFVLTRSENHAVQMTKILRRMMSNE